jgi:nucleoside-diphosphate-sugar epimerase
MRKVLVTGAAGFVGRHIVQKLLEAGDEVHAVDNLSAFTGAIDPADGWPLYDPRHCDNFVFYREDCRQWFNRVIDTDFDYAFHLAAMVGGRLMIENNPLAVADDLAIDAAYWQWAKAARPKKSVCFSSSAAYPIEYQKTGNYVLLREDMISFDGAIGMPDMTYGWAKLTCEYLAQLAYQKHGLKAVCYRPFSGYGEDQDDAYPFPSICKRVLKDRGARTLSVWGTGDQMRDFIHIDDCINGVMATMDRIDDGGAINLSTGILTSFKEFARTAASVAGYAPEVTGMSDKPEGVFARGGDTGKQKALGFIAKVSFQEGITRALDYYLSTSANRRASAGLREFQSPALAATEQAT